MIPLSFYLVTDTHYFEPSLGASGKAFDNYMRKEQYFMRESSAIVKATFEKLAADKTVDTVLIPGDLSKNGEIESHKGFLKELKKLKESGKKIFVITAGHDYGEKSRAFVGDEQIEVEGTPFEILRELYADYGYSQALAVDDSTLTYVAEIAPKVRLLAINCDSKGNPKGTVDERLEAWIKIQLDEAKKDGCKVFAMCHYPMIPSVPVFDLVGDAKLKDWRRTASFLADNGVEFIFTGHMHIQSINEYVSENGNKIYDICTACLVGSPAKYRKVVFDGEKLTVESFDTPDCGCDPGNLTVREYFDNKFSTAIQNRILDALNGGKGAVKVLKRAGKKIISGITLGGFGRLLWIGVDKSIRKVKFIDFAGNIGVAIFKGDMPYSVETPEGKVIAKVLKRFRFIVKKVEPKLSKNGVEVNLTEMLLNSIYNNKGFSDNNAVIELDKN
ncbi:MAG: metallophosphoesterase [Clostridia bacterium]|nr:metallophosphoesterase [Clostridia bacterium]